jgi:hypothetical protein
MAKKIGYYIRIVLTLLIATNVHAQPEDGVGQTIQINTRLQSFIGRPSWLLMIRDIDHNQTIPYVYDISRGDNFWLAFTYGHNYLITASTLQFAPYKANPYRTKVIHNFCNLESHGRIARGESLQVIITGDLSPNTDSYSCNIMRFSDNHFSVPSSD